MNLKEKKVTSVKRLDSANQPTPISSLLFSNTLTYYMLPLPAPPASSIIVVSQPYHVRMRPTESLILKLSDTSVSYKSLR